MRSSTPRPAVQPRLQKHFAHTLKAGRATARRSRPAATGAEAQQQRTMYVRNVYDALPSGMMLLSNAMPASRINMDVTK